MLVLLNVVLCGVLAFFFWRQRRRPGEPPMMPDALPIIGHLHKLGGDSRNFWELSQNMSDDLNKIGGAGIFRIGPENVYVLTDPDDCTVIANTCLQKHYVYEFGKPWLGQGLLTASVPVWKRHRKLLNPAFNQQVLDEFLVVFNSQSARLVDAFSAEVGKGPFEHEPYLRYNGLETICLTSLGVEFGEDSPLNQEYLNATKTIMNVFAERFFKFWWHSRYTYWFSDLRRQQDKAVKILHNMSNTIVQERKRLLEAGEYQKKLSNTKYKPFLDLLLEIERDEEGLLDFTDIRSQVDNMIIGGHDTTAFTLTYALMFIGTYPHIQERLCKELQEVFGDSDRDVDRNDLSKLDYLEAVIKETLRIYPVVPVQGRYVDKDVKLKNHTLYAGNTCVIFTYGVHHGKIWGEDTKVFRPERWLNQTTLPANPNAFSAFSIGRRGCIGKVYAMMSLKTTLVHVLRHYKISANIDKLKLKLDVLLKPDTGAVISLEKRKYNCD